MRMIVMNSIESYRIKYNAEKQKWIQGMIFSCDKYRVIFILDSGCWIRHSYFRLYWFSKTWYVKQMKLISHVTGATLFRLVK